MGRSLGSRWDGGGVVAALWEVRARLETRYAPPRAGAPRNICDPMDLFFGSTSFGPLLFLVGSLCLAAPFAIFASMWRRQPPPPYGADNDPAAAAATAAAAADGAPADGPSCAVCLEELSRDGPLPAALGVAAHAGCPPATDGYGCGGRGRYARGVASASPRAALCCGHVFHTSCIDRWAALCPSTPSCPVCKTPIGAPLAEVFVK